jgi:hypothetical protein
MDLATYQKQSRTVAIYLEQENSRMIYPAMGLIGECGEVADKVKKLIRDDNGQMTQDRKAAVAKELGDVMWYCANVCCDTNNNLSISYGMRGHGISQQIRQLPLFRIVICLHKNASKIANMLDKWYYEDNCDINQSHRYTDISFYLSFVVACVEEIAKHCDCTLEEVYSANIKNLLGRKNRGTLKGDGDDR